MPTLATPTPATDKAAQRRRRWQLAGDIAIILLVIVTAFWAYWGVAEMYYEGWWGPWINRLGYLLPGTAFLLLTLLIIRWPRLGGWLLILLGGAFTAFYWSVQFSRWGFSWPAFLAVFPVSGLLVLLGVIFVFTGRARRQQSAAETPAGATVNDSLPAHRLRRQWRTLLAVGLPLLVLVAISAANLPIIFSRVDDGDRSAQLVAGNGVTLLWAPAGPGWGRGMLDMGQDDFQQPGGVLSWNDLAFYGRPPVGVEEKPDLAGQDCDSTSPAGCATAADMTTTGLCRYLSADGARLSDTPQDIWRMPTVAEMVRSLARHGDNAGCTWDGAADHADCQFTPDKEPPLWDPDGSAVYYWAADEFDRVEAYFINYNGNAVQTQPKSFGNARHGYRCVREP